MLKSGQRLKGVRACKADERQDPASHWTRRTIRPRRHERRLFERPGNDCLTEMLTRPKGTVWTAVAVSGHAAAHQWPAAGKVGPDAASTGVRRLPKRWRNYYRGVDDNQGRVFNKMNQYERANVTLIRAIERGR